MSIEHLVVIVLRPFFVVLYTVSNCRKRPANGVAGRLRPRLIDLGNNAPQFQLNHE